MVYAGLDIGTTGAKITLFEGEKEIGKFYERYSSKRNAEQDEIDANIILKAALKVIFLPMIFAMTFLMLALLVLEKPLFCWMEMTVSLCHPFSITT